jgi:hypothetical protein
VRPIMVVILVLSSFGCDDVWARGKKSDSPFHRTCGESGVCPSGWACVPDYPDAPSSARTCSLTDAGEMSCIWDDPTGLETHICILRCRSDADCPAGERFECITSWGSGGKECAPKAPRNASKSDVRQ